uniref:Uncharacterized protein n=1 Tax=Triticum urartu TaxID=4572 RepID=A0A8R7TFA0_TRIUA
MHAWMLCAPLQSEGSGRRRGAGSAQYLKIQLRIRHECRAGDEEAGRAWRLHRGAGGHRPSRPEEVDAHGSAGDQRRGCGGFQRAFACGEHVLRLLLERVHLGKRVSSVVQ